MQPGLEIKTGILPKQQKYLFDKLTAAEWITPFYLAGGTALALQLGHRQSLDFDFFSDFNFNRLNLLRELGQYGDVMRFSETEGTLHCSLNGVKLSFFYYPHPTIELLQVDRLRLASIIDIALMKFEAIAGRGDKKDFIDLYFILRNHALPDLLKKHSEKYGMDWSNRYHLLKSLVYFNDADDQPSPLMFEDVTWMQVKAEITTVVLKINPLAE